MKTTDKKTYIIAAGTLIAGLLAGWLIFGGRGDTGRDEHQHSVETTAETVWTCSMHPQIRQNEPGDCPICGMDLIPLETDQGSDTYPMSVSMSPTAMQLASVSTAIVGRMAPVKLVRLNGKVQTDGRMLYSQSSHIPGRIEKLSVNFTGEFVSSGQTVARIYSPDLVTAQEELLEAQRIMKTQPQLFNAAKEKLRNWKLSDNQIDEILESGEIEDEFPVRADVTGYVTRRIINLGDYVRQGETLYEIADLSKVWILFDVYESDMAWIKKGDKVKFSIASLPGESFEGIISYLDPVIDPKTRVVMARVDYNNPGGKLKPEMFASGVVEARLIRSSNSLVVPKTAVMWTGKRSLVYIKNSSDSGLSFAMREVTLGPALGDSYIVESGLQEGEEIAVSGTFSIDAAAQLAGKPSMMSPAGGQVMTGHNHGAMSTEVSEVSSDIQQSDKADNTAVISRAAKKALEPVYTDYLELKEALSDDNPEEAKKAAVSMQENLAKVDMGLFTGDSHDAWMNFSNELNDNLQHAPHFSSLEEIREAFRLLSVTMVKMSESFKPFSETLYVQHCPMADNNKGADWLSTVKEIRNPYFGESMLTCGEVTGEIR
jgi:Cu(I)/Ag(I) efflux system membrane fusion protein